MDWLTFFAEVIKALAWPVSVLIIFLALRRPLIGLFPQLQRLRFMDLELDFGRQVQELAVRVQKELPAAEIDADNQHFLEHLRELARLSPRAVVLEAWLQLEKAAMSSARRHNLELPSRDLRSPLALGQALEAAGILDESKLVIYHRLRNLRNAAAHASDFSFDPASALEYAEVAMRLSEYLWKA